MKEIIQAAANIYLLPGDDEAQPLRPMVEVILITSEPKYAVDETGAVIRPRSVETQRAHGSPDAIRQVAKVLAQWADEADKIAATANGKDG